MTYHEICFHDEELFMNFPLNLLKIIILYKYIINILYASMMFLANFIVNLLMTLW